MIRQKLSIERQIDDKQYQFLIPQNGNWQEVLAFCKEVEAYALNQIELSKKQQEEVKEESKTE